MKKLVLISGSGRGLGSSIARSFISAGYRVAINYMKSEEQANNVSNELGENAIYKAIEDIAWFKHYDFERKSSTLGSVNMSVTMIEAGYQHNLVPDTCHFVVDVRTTDVYTHAEILGRIDQ